MAWSAPQTWTTGQIVTAADLNQDIRDNMNYLDANKVTIPAVTGTGDLLTRNNVATWVRLSPGSNVGYVLSSDGADKSLFWANTKEPYITDIDVFMSPATGMNFSTLTTASVLYSGYRESSGAQNAEVGWDIRLAAGTWTVELMHVTGADAGIYTVSLSGADIGTIDGYAAAGANNVLTSITGVAVAVTTLTRRLLIKMSTKNASSSGYAGRIHHIQLRRTA